MLFRQLSKYELEAPLCLQTAIRPGKTLKIPGAHGPRVELHPDGTLIVHPGYYWDGPSGPALDTDDTMRASLVHDALYDLMHRELLSRSHRKAADVLLRTLAIEDGVPGWRATYFYWAVRLFGWLFLRKKGNQMLKLKHLLVLFTLLVLTLVGCTALTPVIRDANRAAAELLCANAYAERMGVSLEDARNAYCTATPLLEPFLHAAKRAQEDAAPESFGIQASQKDK